MHLESLSLVNFKNYEEANLTFSSRINCFVGENGVGKTNLLDSIHYLALCKSYFNVVDSQNIKHDADFSVIQGEFFIDGEKESIYCGIQRSKKKQFRRNKKEYSRLADHIGLIPLVMISPADSSLILDGGEERRKFLNGVISQYDRLYLNNVIQYNRILGQRNKYLKLLAAERREEDEMLEVYNQQLIEIGQEIYAKRKEFVDALIPVFNSFYSYVSQEKEKVSLEYRSQLNDKDFSQLLEESLFKDKVLQYTSAGVHRDDLNMMLDHYPLKKVGSQGQQKTFQLSLKLGKFEFIRQVSSRIPILLLDDVFDKFDQGRVEQIIRMVSENEFGQIFITDTDEERITSILDRIGIENKVFRINTNRKISEIQ